MRIKDKPNRIETTLIVKVVMEFYDDECSSETVRDCIEQDLEYAGVEVIDISIK